MNLKKIINRFEPLILVVLAVIFTIGLMFASVEIPKKFDHLLGQKVDFLALKKGFFEAMGWDHKSGKPDPTTWKQLGLDDLEL